MDEDTGEVLRYVPVGCGTSDDIGLLVEEGMVLIVSYNFGLAYASITRISFQITLATN